MRKDDIANGSTYALRSQDAGAGNELVKVTSVGPVRGRQARVRYEQGELQGLEEWIPTRMLACRWDERTALLCDEEHAARLAAADDELWDRVTEEAISAVMTASGEYNGFLKHWDTGPAPAERYWARARLGGSPLDDHPANYRDRHGTWYLTFATALKAAQAFAAAEPELVDLYLRGWEEKLKAEGSEPGNSYQHDLLREWAPHHALARSWTQEPRDLAAEGEVERLRQLVSTAIQYLRDAGQENKASQIEWGLRRQ